MCVRSYYLACCEIVLAISTVKQLTTSPKTNNSKTGSPQTTINSNSESGIGMNNRYKSFSALGKL